jgi:hypothetical protein
MSVQHGVDLFSPLLGMRYPGGLAVTNDTPSSFKALRRLFIRLFSIFFFCI